MPFVTSDTRHGRHGPGSLGRRDAVDRRHQRRCPRHGVPEDGPDRPRQLPSNVQELETSDLRRGARQSYWWNKARADLHLLDEDGKLPLHGRRVCDVVAPRWLRRRETYALLDGCKAEVIASARGDDGEGRKPLVPLRLREWVKTPYPRWLEAPARVDNEDIALFYRASMTALREQRPTNAHVTDFVEVEWLADLAVMMGERRAMATFAEAMNDPDFHVRGHARCVELVERCAAALSGLIDPYLAGRHQRMWGPTPPSHVSSRWRTRAMLHPSEKWLWVMREDFRSFGLDLRRQKAVATRGERRGRVGQDGRGVQTEARRGSRIDPRDDPKGALRVLTEFLCGVYPGLDAPGDRDRPTWRTWTFARCRRRRTSSTRISSTRSLRCRPWADSGSEARDRPSRTTTTIPCAAPCFACFTRASASRSRSRSSWRPWRLARGWRWSSSTRPVTSDAEFMTKTTSTRKSPERTPGHVVFTADPFEGFDATDPRKLWTIDWDRLEEDAGISADKLLPSARDVVMRMMNNLFLIYHNHEAEGFRTIRISRRIRRTTTEYARKDSSHAPSAQVAGSTRRRRARGTFGESRAPRHVVTTGVGAPEAVAAEVWYTTILPSSLYVINTSKIMIKLRTTSTSTTRERVHHRGGCCWIVG